MDSFFERVRAFASLLVVPAIVVVVGTFFLTIVWSWVIPDVFAGAVYEGLLPHDISLEQAFKLSALLSLLVLVTHADRFLPEG